MLKCKVPGKKLMKLWQMKHDHPHLEVRVLGQLNELDAAVIAGDSKRIEQILEFGARKLEQSHVAVLYAGRERFVPALVHMLAEQMQVLPYDALSSLESLALVLKERPPIAHKLDTQFPRDLAFSQAITPYLEVSGMLEEIAFTSGYDVTRANGKLRKHKHPKATVYVLKDSKDIFASQNGDQFRERISAYGITCEKRHEPLFFNGEKMLNKEWLHRPYKNHPFWRKVKNDRRIKDGVICSSRDHAGILAYRLFAKGYNVEILEPERNES